MSEHVEVPFGDKSGETATLLLAAAEDLGLDPGVVRTTSEYSFVVPEEVAAKAGLDTVSEDEEKSLDDLSKSELQEEIDRRNNGRDEADQIKPDGKNKPDLLKALQADDGKE